MKVNAWIQMGCERREVTFDVSEVERSRRGPEAKKAEITIIFAPNLPNSVMHGGRKATRTELP